MPTCGKLEFDFLELCGLKNYIFPSMWLVESMGAESTDADDQL